MRLQLRDYQSDALSRVAAAEARGVRRQLGVAATGLGKTVMFATMAEQRGDRTLVLAHRDELVTQAAAKLIEVWPDLGATTACLSALAATGHADLAERTRHNARGVGIVKAGADDVHAQVVVASVQTLARPARLARLVDAYEQPGMIAMAGTDRFGLVVVDEAHHAAADSYRAVLDALRAGHTCSDPARHASTHDPHHRCDQGPLLLGVTATPDRGDGKGLDDLFDEITFSYDVLWGIRAGYLADLRGKRVRVERLDLAGVRVRRGDFDQGQAGRAMEDADTQGHIVAAWLEHALGRRTLVFTPTVAMAQLVADEFTRAGVAAGYVHGGTPTDERRQLLADYSAGRITVLANCAVLTEGYDEPRTDCVVIARPTKSRALYTQMVGRGTRRHPDKADCLVIDVVGATETHSLVTVPSLFGLGDQYAERMGDGTGLLAGVVQERDDEQVRLGRMRAEDADLFRTMRGAGIAWVQTHTEGAPLRRYTRPLGGKDDPTVVLAQREPGADVWTAGLWWTSGDRKGEKRVLLADVSMEMAQGVAEDYVRRQGKTHLTDASAPWRKRRPSDKALALAKRWRVAINPAWTAGELSDAIDARIAQVRAREEAQR